RICSWAGICPGNNESAGKKRVVGRAKEGGSAPSSDLPCKGSWTP
ncbi:MAG: transposase, partial [Magnetococcales bacterium]|nr:transposase [Nitrospirota bacterium]